MGRARCIGLGLNIVPGQSSAPHATFCPETAATVVRVLLCLRFGQTLACPQLLCYVDARENVDDRKMARAPITPATDKTCDRTAAATSTRTFGLARVRQPLTSEDPNGSVERLAPECTRACTA